MKSSSPTSWWELSTSITKRCNKNHRAQNAVSGPPLFLFRGLLIIPAVQLARLPLDRSSMQCHSRLSPTTCRAILWRPCYLLVRRRRPSCMFFPTTYCDTPSRRQIACKWTRSALCEMYATEKSDIRLFGQDDLGGRRKFYPFPIPKSPNLKDCMRRTIGRPVGCPGIFS